jgi:hypothetical protein
MDVLLNALSNDTSETVRNDALCSLTYIASEKYDFSEVQPIIDILIDVLRNDPSENVRSNIPECLMLFIGNSSEIKIQSMVDLYVDVLKNDPSGKVRSEVVASLGYMVSRNSEIEVQPVLDVMIDMIKNDSSEEARSKAVFAVRNILSRTSDVGIKPIFDILISVVKNDPSENVRSTTIFAVNIILSRYPDIEKQPVVDVLIEVLKNNSSELVASAAANALKNILIRTTEIEVQPVIDVLIGILKQDYSSKIKASIISALNTISQHYDLAETVIPVIAAEILISNIDNASLRSSGNTTVYDVLLKNQEFLNIFEQYTGFKFDDIIFDKNKISNFGKDLCMLAQLYNKFGADAAKYLNEDYNIQFFGRYTLDVLSHMYENRNERVAGKPLAVVSFSKRDNNGAFYHSAQKIQQLLDEGYDVRIVEVVNEGGFETMIKKMNEKYGSIDTLVIGGHGNPSAILKSASMGSQDPQDKYIDLGDTDVLNAIKPCLSANLDIVLISCSTGKGDNSIGEFISKTLNARVLAPDNNTNIDGFVIDHANGTPYLTGVKYWSSTTTMIFDNRIFDDVNDVAASLVD